jgi:hypothetical protein
MAAVVALPSDLRNRIAAVARRVLWLRFWRGLSLLTLILALAFGAGLLADVLCQRVFSFDLPNAVRIGVLAAWGGIGLLVFAVGLVLPLIRRFDAAAVAALVEEKYPELAERLTTSVELAGRRDEFHGAPELIEQVIRDADACSLGLNFLPAVSPRAARGMILAAAGAVVVVLGPALVWPGQYADLAERFFQPWVTPPTFLVAAAPAQDFAARGRPLTLTAHVTQRRHVALPDACTLVQITADGRETRTAMAPVKAGDYQAAVTPTADFHFRVEAGPDSSPAYAVQTIQPVDLAADSPEITTTPPDYAKETVETDVADGLVDATVLQNGAVRFDCKFTRAAEHAYLEWTARKSHSEKDGAATPVRTTIHELTLGPDRRAGALTLQAPVSGQYRLRLVAERGIETVFPEHVVTVTPDQPPAIRADDTTDRALGAGAAGLLGASLGQGPLLAASARLYERSDERKEVLPYDRVPLAFFATDDVAVAAAELEYRINGADPVRAPIAATGFQTKEASLKDAFDLAGKVNPGDRIEYRIRVADNLPPEFGGPHVVYYPSDHALVLHVATDKEIIALRDDVNSRLEKIKNDLKHEENGLYKTRSDSRDRALLTPEQARRVDEAKNENSDTANELNELADKAAVAPALQELANLARDVAAKEMEKSAKSLDAATAADKLPAEREEHFKNAETELDSAYHRLEQMEKKNDELAQKALAEEELAKLADKEKELAQKAADLAAKDPVKDPSAKEQADQLKQQQEQNTQALQKLTDDNPALRQALDEARSQEARDLSERAKELAQQQRDLAQAAAETEKKQNTDRLADLARKQQALADKANELAEKTKDSAQAAKTNPLKPDDAQKAADELKQGEADEALKNQNQAAHELDRIADDLTKAADLAKDPKEAARQLARMEDGLKQKVQDEAKKQNDPRPLNERLKPIAEEQKAIHDAIGRLSVPPADQPVQQDKKQAEEQAAKADDLMKQNRPLQAANQMDQTKHALEKLADDLPSLDKRKDDALKEIAQLRKQQDEIAQKTEQAAEQARDADKKDPRAQDQVAQLKNEAARKQADAAERLAKMDAPNQEAQQQRTADALNEALKDLMDGRKTDPAASQEDAKHQLERLEQALQGKPSAEEKTAERPDSAKPTDSPRQAAQKLAEQQRQLAQQTQQAQNKQNQKPGEAGKQAMQEALAKVAEKQQELNDAASQLPAGQHQKALEQAHEAMNQAQQALERNEGEQAKQKQNEAADALQRLAQQLPAKAPETAPKPQTGDAQAPPGLPNKEQANQARDLAKQQRELQDELRRAQEAARAEANAPKENPLGDLAKQQQEVAKQAAQQTQDTAEQEGKDSEPARQASQAQKAAQQAADQLQAGALQKAQQAGRQAAEQMHQTAKQLAQTPNAARKAEQLAAKQDAINQRLDAQADNAAAQRAQQDAQQQNLRQQTEQWTKDVSRLGQQEDQAHRGQQANQARQAAAEGRQAQSAMQQAQQQGHQGDGTGEQQQQQQAAQALEQASQQLAQAGQPANAQGNPQGQAVQQAQKSMQQAQGKLNQGQAKGAQEAMAQAAQALAQAAQQASPDAPPGQQGGRLSANGVAPGGAPDMSKFTLDGKQFDGKAWGQLPGELRTKIVQEMRKKYGDDYARMIKLYFEQAADTRDKK